MDLALSKLHSRARNSLPTSCRDRFDKAVSHSMSDIPAITLLKGLSIDRKLVVFQNAVEIHAADCEAQHCSHPDLRILIFPILFNTLRSFANASSAKISHDTSASKIVSKQTRQDKKLPTSTNRSAASKKTSPLTQDTSSSDKKVIYTEVAKQISAKPTKYHRHIQCKTKQCKFCRDMYSNVTLSRCDLKHTGKKCVPSGWFPHVGIVLWKKLKSAHARGESFKCQPIAPREDNLESLSQYTRIDDNLMEDDNASVSSATTNRTDTASADSNSTIKHLTDEDLDDAASGWSSYTPKKVKRRRASNASSTSHASSSRTSMQ